MTEHVIAIVREAILLYYMSSGTVSEDLVEYPTSSRISALLEAALRVNLKFSSVQTPEPMLHVETVNGVTYTTVTRRPEALPMPEFSRALPVNKRPVPVDTVPAAKRRLGDTVPAAKRRLGDTVPAAKRRLGDTDYGDPEDSGSDDTDDTIEISTGGYFNESDYRLE